MTPAHPLKAHLMDETLIQLADKALAADDDHMEAASGEDLVWLIAQLACWPTRVDQDCTTNMRFLMMSAAATLRASLPEGTRS